MAGPISSDWFAPSTLNAAPTKAAHAIEPVALEQLEAADAPAIALYGVPDDTGVQLNGGRPGAAEAPSAFREALGRVGSADAEALPSNRLPRIVDVGDVLPADSLPATHDRVSAVSGRLAELGYCPVLIGGGHDLTYPHVRGVSNAIDSPLRGAYLDAHLDVREADGSGMPFRRLLSEEIAESMLCVGYSPMVNTSAHAEWFGSNGGRTIRVENANAEQIDADFFQNIAINAPGFVSIDLDGFDAAHAPGVSALNPCGLQPALGMWLSHRAGANRAIRCFDLMELNPRFDRDNQTARLAAALFLSFVSGFVERPRPTAAGAS